VLRLPAPVTAARGALGCALARGAHLLRLVCRRITFVGASLADDMELSLCKKVSLFTDNTRFCRFWARIVGVDQSRNVLRCLTFVAPGWLGGVDTRPRGRTDPLSLLSELSTGRLGRAYSPLAAAERPANAPMPRAETCLAPARPG